MQARLLVSLLTVLWIGVSGLSAMAQDRHPTATAIHRYTHRKTAHVRNAAHHTRQRFRHWKHRKAHNFRAWLKRH